MYLVENSNERSMSKFYDSIKSEISFHIFAVCLVLSSISQRTNGYICLCKSIFFIETRVDIVTRKQIGLFWQTFIFYRTLTELFYVAILPLDHVSITQNIAYSQGLVINYKTVI